MCPGTSQWSEYVETVPLKLFFFIVFAWWRLPVMIGDRLAVVFDQGRFLSRTPAFWR